jgi:hypothetical protein
LDVDLAEEISGLDALGQYQQGEYQPQKVG